LLWTLEVDGVLENEVWIRDEHFVLREVVNAHTNLFNTPPTPAPHTPAKRPANPATFDFLVPRQAAQCSPTPSLHQPSPSPSGRFAHVRHLASRPAAAHTTTLPRNPNPQEPASTTLSPTDTHVAYPHPRPERHHLRCIQHSGDSRPMAPSMLPGGKAGFPPAAPLHLLSPALTTAFCQCAPVEPAEPSSTKEGKALVAFHFRPALMHATNVQVHQTWATERIVGKGRGSGIMS
jgi:hypothetical protein